MATFAERLRHCREKAGYSQKELAAEIGISVAAYNKYETRGNEPKIDVLIKLATLLDTDVNTLVGFNPKQKSKLTRYLQLYMDIAKKDFIIWNEANNGYIVFLDNGKFFVSQNDMEQMVNTCIKEVAQRADEAIKTVVNLKNEMFATTFAIKLREFWMNQYPAPADQGADESPTE